MDFYCYMFLYRNVNRKGINGIMTDKEFRELAKSMGYNVIKTKKYEKLLPCTCGCTRRENYSSFTKFGDPVETLTCAKCGKSVSGKTKHEVRQNWNKMIRGE